MYDRLPRRDPREFKRSQLAMELALHAYAFVTAAVLFRLVLLLLETPSRLWITDTVFGLTDPIIRPLRLLPGADRQLLAGITLPDATLAALLLLVPLWMLARPRHTPRRH